MNAIASASRHLISRDPVVWSAPTIHLLLVLILSRVLQLLKIEAVLLVGAPFILTVIVHGLVHLVTIVS